MERLVVREGVEWKCEWAGFYGDGRVRRRGGILVVGLVACYVDI